MSKRNRELFRLPPYILYVTRAFSTLEGLGLSINPNYSILQECYPYLSNRLLTDNKSLRAKEALRSMLLGKDGEVFSPSKLAEITEQFSSYKVATATLDDSTSTDITLATTNSNSNFGTTSFGNTVLTTTTTTTDTQNKAKAEIALAKILLSPNGNFIQEILLEGAAKTADALVRGTVHDLIDSAPGRTLKNIIKTPINIVHNFVPKPLQPLLAPITLPYEVLNAMKDLLEREEVDENVLQRMASLSELVSATNTNTNSDNNNNNNNGGGSNNMSSNNNNNNMGDSSATTEPKLTNRQMTRVLLTELTKPDSTLRNIFSDPEIRQQLPSSVTNISRKLVVSLLHRAAERIETTIQKQELNLNMNNNNNNNSNSNANRLVKSTGEFTKQTAERLANILSTFDTPTTTSSTTTDTTSASNTDRF